MDGRSGLKKAVWLYQPSQAAFMRTIFPSAAKVTPLTTVFVSATEGGRVEEILTEDGTIVEQGQSIVVLSNPSLQLERL